MSVTPIPLAGWAPTPGLSSLSEAEGVRLAHRLPVTPYNVIPFSGLSRGIDRAFVAGSVDAPDAVIVQHRTTPAELEFLGTDPEAAWMLLSRIPGWNCVNGSTEDITRLAPVLERELREPLRWIGDMYYILEGPARPHEHPAVRRLGLPDVPLLQRAAPDLTFGGYRTYEELVTEGIVAAAVVDGRVVAIADNAYSNARFADIGVRTLEAHRRQGLSSAATYQVVCAVQARGLVPIWSTGSHNLASQRVATKVGFRPYGRGEYVVADALKASGGYRPR